MPRLLQVAAAAAARPCVEQAVPRLLQVAAVAAARPCDKKAVPRLLQVSALEMWGCGGLTIHLHLQVRGDQPRVLPRLLLHRADLQRRRHLPDLLHRQVRHPGPPHTGVVWCSMEQ